MRFLPPQINPPQLNLVFRLLCVVTYDPCRNKAHTIKHNPLPSTLIAQLVKPCMFTSFFIASHRHIN